MAFQAVPDGIEIVMNGSQNGYPIVNVFWSKTAGGVTDAMLASACGAVFTWWTAFLKPHLHVTYALNSIVATDKSVEGGHQHTVAYTSANQGALTGAAASANTAAVISAHPEGAAASLRTLRAESRQ